MKIPITDGTLRKATRALGFALLFAATPCFAAWDCQDTGTGIRPTRHTQFAIGRSESQPPDVAAKKLERLERDATSSDDKVVLYERLGKLYFRNGRFDDAQRVYSAGFNLEEAATAIRENFRAALAIVLARLQRHTEVIELFERSDRPVCPTAMKPGKLALAFAYTAAHEYDKAEAVTTALLADQEGVDPRALSTLNVLHMKLGCARKDEKACAARWEALLRNPQRDDEATQALLERVDQLTAWPTGRLIVEAAQRDGLIEGRHVNTPTQRVAELVPLSRVAPEYPKLARTQGLSGSVELELEVGVDGRVQNVRVLKSTPAKVFDAAALSAVREWMFKPGVAGGKPAPVIGTQVIDFAIEDAAY